MFAVDLLDGGRPRRLKSRGGRWTLEVERLRAVDHGIFRPHTQRIEGEEPILWFLRKTGAALEQPTQAILAQGAAPERTFELYDGRWVPSGVLESRRQRRRDPELELARLRDTNSELRTEVAVLRRRLAELERQLRAGGAERPGAAPAGRVEHAPSSPLVAAPPARGGAEPADAVAATEHSPGEVAQRKGSKKGRYADRPKRRVKLPELDDLAKCVSQLVGNDYSLRALPESEHKPVAELEHFYCSLLTGNDEQPLAVLLASFRTTALLGGTLMMLPEAELEAALARGEVPEDAVEAMSEVLNTLSSEFNLVRGNPHLRSRPCEIFTPELAPWLDDPRERVDLSDSCDGQLLFFSY